MGETVYLNGRPFQILGVAPEDFSGLDVGTLDALTFTAVAGLLIAIALIASYVPARRATQADPLAPLRQQ